MVIYMILRPDSAQTHQMDQGLLFAPGDGRSPVPSKLDMSMSSVSHIVSQDLHVDEMVQVGLRSRYASAAVYSWKRSATPVEPPGWFRATWSLATRCARGAASGDPDGRRPLHLRGGSGASTRMPRRNGDPHATLSRRSLNRSRSQDAVGRTGAH